MHRLAVRIAAIALGAGALGGCGAFDGSSTDANNTAAHAADPSPLAPDVAVSVRQAQTMRLAGDVVGATRIMSQLMLAYPDDARVVGEYGKLLVQEKASNDAVAFLRRAIELSPNDWSVYSALGVAFDQQNDAASARFAYERALALKPGEPAVLNNYAMSRMLAGDAASARTLLMQAQASGSADPRIASNLALLDRAAPVPAKPATTPVAAPTRALATTAPTPKPVTQAAMPPVATASASGAPKPLERGGARIVMQEVPIDPLAGPVARHAGPAPKPSKSAKAAPHHPAARVAAAAPKPPKKAKPGSDHIPALRMTADASKP